MGSTQSTWGDHEVHRNCVAFPHALDPHLYIFAKHSSDKHTKMAAFRIESHESSPIHVEGRFHRSRLLPIDAKNISDTWDTARGKVSFDEYRVTDIMLHAETS